MRVLVTGGTGFLGRYIVSTLLAQGVDVRLLGRNMREVQHLIAAGAEPWVADLRDGQAIVAACRGMTAVVHAGALSSPWGAYEDFWAINVGGTEAVIAGCVAHGVTRLVHISSPSVTFAGRDVINAREDAPYPQRFSSHYAATKKAAEDRVRAAAAQIETVVLRPKAIFGAGDRSLLPRLLAAAQRGRLPQIGDGQNRVDVTYVENAAYATLLALRAERAVGGVYTITNHEHIVLWDLIREILRRRGLETKLRRMPLRGALVAAALMEAAAAITHREPLLTRYSVQLLGCSQTYDTQAAQRDLEYAPILSVREGVERTISSL